VYGTLAVKVCGLREPENVVAVCALRPNYVGFIFVPHSKRFVGETPNPAAFAAVPDDIGRVAVFADAAFEHIERVVKTFNFKSVQLHGSEDVAYREKLRSVLPNVQIIQAVSVTADVNLAALNDSGVDLFLFDNGRGGTGQAFDWGRLREYRSAVPFLLAGGISVGDIGRIRTAFAEEPKLFGIDVNSAVETAPGIKDTHSIEALLREVRS
jgi:phosphoribosylanthranilate isomerase